MRAEEIVEVLAESNPHHHATGEWYWCGLCGMALTVEAADHQDACPWRLAVEWVHAHELPSPKV